MKKIYFLTLGILFLQMLHAQPSRPGAGRSLDFNPSNNEYVDLGTAFSNLALPATVCAWIKVPSTTSWIKIFSSSQDSNGYVGFNCVVLNSGLQINVGSGNGGFTPSNRISKSASININPGEWIHAAFVIHSFNNIDIYENGIDIGGTYSGYGTNYSSGSGGTGSIGRSYGSQGWDYGTGEIDELSIWNKALTETEIRNLMCHKLNANDTSLLAYYTFDEGSGTTLHDKSPNGNNGTLINTPTWHYSGAPIGDYSSYSYSSTPAFHESIPSTMDSIVIQNFAGNVDGAQFYRVDSLPNQQTNLNLIPGYNYYWGVFAFGTGNISYSTDLYYNPDTLTKYNHLLTFKYRDDNSISYWTNTNKMGNQAPLNVSHLGSAEWSPSVLPCTTPGVADFTYQKGSTALSIEFTNTSANADSIFWNFGDGSYSSNSNPTHVFSNANVYNVCLTISDSCGVITKKCENVNPGTISLKELSFQNQLNIYPNPVSDHLTIHNLEKYNQDILFTLTDINGKLIFTGKLSLGQGEDYSLNTSALAKGLYLLKLEDPNGDLFTTKVIKH